MKQYFTTECPYCKSKEKVVGFWDWENGFLCIMGMCKKCKTWIFEEDADWQKVKKINLTKKKMKKLIKLIRES